MRKMTLGSLATAADRARCRVSRTGAVVLLAVAAPAAAAAQTPPDTFRLGAVVVTAARLPTSPGTAPGTITVLDSSELRARGIRFVSDALRTVPGVTVVQSAGPGALTAVFMRGGESDYVQVLVDGVQVNDPGGAFDWAHLRTEDIERIEIVRGPASVLYGSDAVAGVVQIFTRAGGRTHIEAGVSGERGNRHDSNDRFYTRSYDVAATGSAAAPVLRESTFNYGFGAAHTNADGLYAYNSDYDNTALTARLQLVAPRYDVAVSGRRGDNEYHYPTTGSGAVLDRNQFATGDTRSLGLDGGFRFSPTLELRLLATDYDSDGRTQNPPDSPGDGSFTSDNWLARRSIDARINAQLYRQLVLTVGAEHERQHGTTAFESFSSFGTFADSTDNRRENSGYYAQLHGSPVRDVAVTVGARIDDNSAFGNFTTARAAISWQAHAGARVHAAAGTAFKEPTFFENFATGFARGNPALEPERARSWEIGAEHGLAHDAVTLGATWFDQRFRNLIQYTFATPTPGAPNYSNVGAARARGLELSARAQHARLGARASYTYTNTLVTADGFGSDRSFEQDRPLLRRPRHQAAINASITLLRLRLDADARFVGEREDLDFTDPANFSGTRTTLDAYTTAGAGMSWDALHVLGSDVQLALRVRNLFAADYQEIYNFPTAGRVFQLGLRATR